MAGLLTLSVESLASSRLVAANDMVRVLLVTLWYDNHRLTAAGTVQDSHLFPF